MNEREAKLEAGLKAALSNAAGWQEEAKALLSPKEAYACFVEVGVGEDPDGCVLDDGRPGDCVYAEKHKRKERCPYWASLTPENYLRAKAGEPVVRR